LIVRGIEKRLYLHHSPWREVKEVESVLVGGEFNAIH